MTPTITTTEISGAPGMPVLMVGPSLGTAVEALWCPVAAHLPGLHVIGWDLPGHGHSPAPENTYSIASLARAITQAVERTTHGQPVHYAGVSVSGAVGLQLLLDDPAALRTATLLCTGARIGDPDEWRTRARIVSSDGTAVLLPNARARWFSSAFAKHHPATVQTVLDNLPHVDRAGYAATCLALADFDQRSRLPEITLPVLAIAGADDIVTPPSHLKLISERVRYGRYAEIPDAAHLAPLEQPAKVASLIATHLGRLPRAV
ncbi:hypothetical protein A5742_04855 [Mycolicibacterium fortuitum]|uniref:AB hydrolase-1 domain-containing protein n=1 Tax=Mycolicibacterium fortuitum TaxID=1766 RepID=A0ABD6QIA5_MYCFO|nr:alpha/beta fold hydrolase [Mycolicibacterium fortuitum]OMC39551.1 hypothetical protein A5742_04855 [Mycolicibacterium fortuitum]